VYEENNQKRTLNLQGGDLVWLVDYLDKACTTLPFPTLDSLPRRLLMVSTPPVPSSGSTYVN